jgi:protein-disulfide isomerase
VAPNRQPLLIAVYIVLGILVIASSFYAGFLVGKSSALNAGTPKGNGGELAGELQIIEYSDYQCPFCGRVEPTVEQIRQNYGDKVQIVYKNYPLESIHPYALNAAIAAECARNQGEDKFWQYHDKLFQNQQALDVPQLKQYAADLGLNTGKFNTCLDNKETEPRVRADMQEAQAKGVSGTPSFWIKDELVVGAQPYAVFQQKIDDKLAGKAPAAPQPPAAPEPVVKADVATGEHILGDPKAKVTIVEFSDYQCPFCKRFYTDTEGQIRDQYVKSGKVKIAFRNFPLPFHSNAQIAAEAAECAAKVGGNDAFWKYHDTLFTKGDGDGTGLDAASLKQYAKDQGLDTAKFNTCLDNHETKAIVDKDTADGSAAGVQGTPTSYINGKQVVGALPFANFKTEIDTALSS